MSPTSVLTTASPSLEPLRFDRRQHVRFPLRLEVHYRVLELATTSDVETGTTLNISTGGVLFKSTGPLPPGAEIRLSVTWPVLLGGACRLKLIMIGKVVRSDATGTAVKAIRHEFRTSKIPPTSA